MTHRFLMINNSHQNYINESPKDPRFKGKKTQTFGFGKLDLIVNGIIAAF